MIDEILLTLLRRSPMTAGEIARQLEADAGTVSKQCGAMMGRGLLFVDGDKRIERNLYPRWALTSAGAHVARETKTSRAAKAWLGKAKPEEVEE